MRPLVLAAGLALGEPVALHRIGGEGGRGGGEGKVRIAPCAGKPDRMCGVITWLKDPANAVAKDARNPDQAQRSRPLMGLPMIWNFRQVGPGKWTGGKIYDPGEGKTYDSKISINANGTLKVEGCILMICQAQTWKRS